MALGPAGGMSGGAKMAIGVLLLWFGGACLFIAFMSGKVPSLTAHKDQNGKAVGPRDASELVTRVADNVQAAASSTGTGGTESSSGEVSA